MKVMWQWTIVFLLFGCNASDLETEESTSSVQSATSGDASNAIAPDDETSSSPEKKESAMDEEALTANEPVAVGGAFLQCSYQDNQNQDAANMLIDCGLQGATGTPGSLEAEFFKQDLSGNVYRLAVVDQDIESYRWVVSEMSTTMAWKTIVAKLAIDGGEPVTFTTEIEDSLQLNLVEAYWLGGEPNNMTDADPAGENCVEFVNQIGQDSHISFTMLPSGPLGRMNDQVCSVSHDFLCRRTVATVEPKWLISNLTGPYSDHPMACPAGYSFGFPISEAEVAEVRSLVDEVQVDYAIWVNLQDRESESLFRLAPYAP